MQDLVPDKFVRYPSVDAREALASRLGYMYLPISQDWEWETADMKDFDRYAELYLSIGVTTDEQLSLMEMMIQAVEDEVAGRATVLRIQELPNWITVGKLLQQNAHLHAMTIAYWTCLDAEEPDDPEQQFYVSGPMRQIWSRVLPELIRSACNWH